jgi:signal transduction histidine kinase
MLLGATTGAMAATLARSIARRRRLEAALARTRREHDAAIRTLSERQGLETLGRLTAGVAHDMGNVMQAVEFYLSAIPDSVDDREALTRLVARARGAARRGATGARDLLALARGSGGRPEPIELARLLTELAEVMQELLGEPYRVRLDLPPTLPPVLAEAGDLEAMLVNLATNSRDAMASAGTGVLTIRAALVGVPDAPGDAPNNTPNDVPGGEWVRIDITDTGVGMDAETLARSMEPFFTTKPRGRGTGLGLALAREFADRSGGLLQIESMPGSGTRASLFLHPATDAKVNDDAESSTDTLRSRSPWVGSGSPRTAEARP